MNHLFDQQLKQALQQVELPKHSAHRKQLRKSTLQLYNASHSPKRMTWKPFVFFTLPAAVAVAAIGLVLTQLPHQATPLATLSPKEVLADSLENTIKLLEQSDGTYIKAEADYNGFAITYESWKQGYNQRVDNYNDETFGSTLSLRPDPATQLLCSTDAVRNSCFTMAVSDSMLTLDVETAPNFTLNEVAVVEDDQEFSTGKELAITITTAQALSEQADIRLVDADAITDGFSMVGAADFFNRADGVLPNEYNAKQLADGSYQYRIIIPESIDIRYDDPNYTEIDSNITYVQFTDGALVSKIYNVNSDTLTATLLTAAEVQHIKDANKQYEQNMALSELERDEAQGSTEPFGQLKREYAYALDNGEVLDSKTDTDGHLVINYRYQYPMLGSGETPTPVEATFTIDQNTKRVIGYSSDGYNVRITEVRPLTEQERTVTLSEADWKAQIREWYQTYVPDVPLPDLETAHY